MGIEFAQLRAVLRKNWLLFIRNKGALMAERGGEDQRSAGEFERPSSGKALGQTAKDDEPGSVLDDAAPGKLLGKATPTVEGKPWRGDHLRSQEVPGASGGDGGGPKSWSRQ